MQRAWHVGLRYEQDEDDVEHEDVAEVAIMVASPDYRDRADITDRHLVLNVIHRHNDGEIQMVEQLWDADEIAAFCLRLLTMLKADDRLDDCPTWIATLLTDYEEEGEEDSGDEDEDEDGEEEDESDDDEDEDEDEDGEEGEDESPPPPKRQSSRRKKAPPRAEEEETAAEEVFDEGGDDDFDDTEEDDAEEEDDD